MTDDPVLSRTLRRIEEERDAACRTRTLIISAVIVVVALAALGGGVVIGRGAEPTVAAAAVPGTKQLTSSGSGVKLAATVVPADGWVRVHASVSGIPAGAECRLVVVSRTGRTAIAGSWLVSAEAAGSTTGLDGTALVAPGDVAAVEVQNLTGYVFTTARSGNF